MCVKWFKRDFAVPVPMPTDEHTRCTLRVVVIVGGPCCGSSEPRRKEGVEEVSEFWDGEHSITGCEGICLCQFVGVLPFLDRLACPKHFRVFSCDVFFLLLRQV